MSTTIQELQCAKGNPGCLLWITQCTMVHSCMHSLLFHCHQKRGNGTGKVYQNVKWISKVSLQMDTTQKCINHASKPKEDCKLSLGLVVVSFALLHTVPVGPEYIKSDCLSWIFSSVSMTLQKAKDCLCWDLEWHATHLTNTAHVTIWEVYTVVPNICWQ